MYKCGQKQLYEQYYPQYLSQIKQPNIVITKAQVAPIYSPPNFFKRGQNIAVYNSLQPALINSLSYFDNSKEAIQPQVSSLLIFKSKKKLIFFN